MEKGKIVFILIVLILAFGQNALFAQASLQNRPDVLEDYPDVYPEFPGGIDSLTSFLKRNFQYPQQELKSRIQGVAQVEFIVDTVGQLKDIKIKETSGNDNFDAEALRLVRKMPKWKPALLNDKAVSMYFTIPIIFTLR